MSEARAITNLIGNGVATIVVSKMEGDFDVDRYHTATTGRPAKIPSPVEAICFDGNGDLESSG